MDTSLGLEIIGLFISGAYKHAVQVWINLSNVGLVQNDINVSTVLYLE